MFEIIKVSLLKEIKYYYSSKLAVISQLFNEIIILTVFWYTAKAFVPNIKVFGTSSIDYFTFIVIGETVLRIPSFFITVITRELKNATLNGTFESLLLFPQRPQMPFIISAISSSLIEFTRVCMVLVIAKYVFAIKLELFNCLLAFILQFFSLPIFIGLGLLSVSIFLFLGRGDGLIIKVVSIATILAGAYFPISVLPEAFGSTLKIISPFNLLLDSTRNIFSSGYQFEFFIKNMTYLLIWGGILFPLGYYLFGTGLKHYKDKNRPFCYVS